MSTIPRRTLWVAALFTVAGGLILGQLYHWQIRAGTSLARAAVDQRMLALPLAPRGRILDRHGEPLSDPRPVAAVAVFPPLLTAADGPERLAAALGMPAAALRDQLANRREPFWLARGLPADAAAAVRAQGLAGVAVATVEQRYGPASLAHHLVGYVNDAGGQLGLEATWDRALTGTAGPYLAAYLDGRGRSLAGLGVRQTERSAGLPPHQLYLTVDGRVQAMVEAALDRSAMGGAAGALRAAVVVLDAHSGDVLAMASRPDFDPRSGPAGVTPGSGALVNRAVAAYPPGSVMKPLVVAAALADGLVAPGERFDCPGHITIGDETFWDWKPDGHGDVDLEQALAESCNIALIEIGYHRLGRERLLAAARRFGLGAPTGLDVWGEAAGSLPDANYGGEVAQMAFGQGLTVTPLQVARAYAALAGDGRLVATRLVERLVLPDGEVRFRPPPAPESRAVPAWVAREVAGALAAATNPAGNGTGRAAWVEEHGSAGKTGTAQAVVDSRTVNHAWFAGWTPVRKPRYIIVVLVEEGGSGAQAAAPLFRAIARDLLSGG